MRTHCSAAAFWTSGASCCRDWANEDSSWRLRIKGTASERTGRGQREQGERGRGRSPKTDPRLHQIARTVVHELFAGIEVASGHSIVQELGVEVALGLGVLEISNGGQARVRHGHFWGVQKVDHALIKSCKIEMGSSLGVQTRKNRSRGGASPSTSSPAPPRIPYFVYIAVEIQHFLEQR